MKNIIEGLRKGDKVKVICESSWKGEIGEFHEYHPHAQTVSLAIGGLRVGFGLTEIEPVIEKPKRGISINRFCTCIRGRFDKAFTKGKAYRVLSLYQDPDGTFMVEVIDNLGWAVQAKAVRFDITKP
jgi:hypothetical protein